MGKGLLIGLVLMGMLLGPSAGSGYEGTVVVDRPVLAGDGEVTGITGPGEMVYIQVDRRVLPGPPVPNPAPMRADKDGRFQFKVNLSDAVGVGVSLEGGAAKDFAPVEWWFWLPLLFGDGGVIAQYRGYG